MRTRSSRSIPPALGMLSPTTTRSGRKRGGAYVGTARSCQRSKKTAVAILNVGEGKDEENTKKNLATQPATAGDNPREQVDKGTDRDGAVVPMLGLPSIHDATTEQEDKKERKIDAEDDGQIGKDKKEEEQQQGDDNSHVNGQNRKDKKEEEEQGDINSHVDACVVLHGVEEESGEDTETDDEVEIIQEKQYQEATVSAGMAMTDDHEASNASLVASTIVTSLPGSSAVAGAQRSPVVVTEACKEFWRGCMLNVRKIGIPYAPDTRPMRIMNAFVTKATVFLAYLIVHADLGKPFPNISKNFEIKEQSHQIDAMCSVIADSKFPYTRQWNTTTDPRHHILSNTSIGLWLANSICKVKYNQTWKIEEGRVVGNKNGLYEPYKRFLEDVGVRFPNRTKKASSKMNASSKKKASRTTKPSRSSW